MSYNPPQHRPVEIDVAVLQERDKQLFHKLDEIVSLLKEQNTRIKKLEEFRWKLTGGMVCLVFVLSWVGKLLP